MSIHVAAPQHGINKLAWRNLWRHRRRTLLLVLVVSYATLITIFFWGLTDGFGQSILSSHARYLAAPVTVTASAYHTDPDPQNALPSLDFVAALPIALRSQAAPRVEFPALLRSAYRSQPVQGRGVLPAKEAHLNNLHEKVGLGRMIAAPGEVVLGVTLAERLNVRVGERVVLDSSAPQGPQAAGLVVTGLLRTGQAALDEGTVLLHLQDAKTLTGVTTATSVSLPASRGQEAAIARTVQRMLPPNTTAYPISEKLGLLSRELQNSRLQMFPVGILLSVFAALAVSSTILVSVLERTREFGVMVALGLSNTKLARLVIAEALLATVIGWVIGLLLGYALTNALGHWNVLGPLFSLGGTFKALGIGDEIYTASHWTYGVYAAITLLLAAVFTALAPAKRVRQLNPASAMRAD